MKRFLTIAVFMSMATVGYADDSDLAASPIRFAILGDRTGGHQDHVFDSVVVEVERMRPDFVMTVGDMIEGYLSDTAAYTAEWREFMDIMAPLTRPVHYTPGNHDITNEIAVEPYRQYVGEPVYSFDFRGLHIAVLDNSRREWTDGWPQDQLDWLANDLQAHQDAAYKMVFFHKPFWYNTVYHGNPDGLHEVCKQYGVDAVVCGHFHAYFSGTFDGIQYTAIGSSGAHQGPDTTYMSYHFAWVTVDNSGIHIVPVRHSSVETWNHTTVDEFFFRSATAMQGLTMAKPLRLADDLALQDSVITLTVRNMSAATPLKDSVRWDLPVGWTLEPPAAAVDVAPDGVASVSFTAHHQGELYPLPEARTRLPYNAERSHAAAQTLRVARQAQAFQAGKAPKLDGVLDEPCWREPQVALFNWDGTKAVTEPVEFYFAYDKNNLYLAAFCHETEPDSVRAAMTSHDASVYTEDCVGYFLQPRVDSPVVYQIYVNPKGAVFDQKITPNPDGYFNGDMAWNGDYEVATGHHAEGWTVEMRIPVAQFGVKKFAVIDWGLSFRRKQPRLGTSDWQLREGYDPSAFGRLVFAK